MLSATRTAPALLALLLAGCSAETDAPVSAAPDAALAKSTTAAAESEDALVARALAIHDRVLTFDSHADTPLRMIEPGFDMAERHDPNDTGSKVDYPRMQEGGLDAIFFAAFVAQDIRDDAGNGRAKALSLQMIDAVIESTKPTRTSSVSLWSQKMRTPWSERASVPFTSASRMGIRSVRTSRTSSSFTTGACATSRLCTPRTTTSQIRRRFRRPGTRRRQRLW